MRSSFHGDRPLGEGDKDRLGFQPTATRLAQALISQSMAGGLVVGVEGKWGSGKSSFVFLLLQSLRELHPNKRPAIVEFMPWLVGNRDALLTTLFAELAKAIDTIALEMGDATGVTITRTKEAAEQIRDFAAKLGSFGPLVSAAGYVLPGASVAGDILNKLNEFAGNKLEGPSLVATKNSLSDSLSKIGKRIIVTIDDVDRLEPLEIMEILRLVRSVADFPNVVYVVCYDQNIIAQSIESSTSIKDGNAFLEKIVQVTVHTPLPEAFDLRRWFSLELAEFAKVFDELDRKRLQRVIDSEGARRLKTPRAVVRALNLLRLLWPALHREVDLSDLVWLQLVKAGNPSLYRWIEDYCLSMAVTGSGRAHVTEENEQGALAELEKILAAEGTNFEAAKWELQERLPGFNSTLGGKRKIFNKVGKRERADAVSGRRLASPDHYRLYFALTVPTNAPDEKDYRAFWKAADKSSAAIGNLLLNWLEKTLTNGASKAEVFLQRLGSVDRELMSAKRSERVLLAFSNILDDSARLGGSNEWGTAALWRDADDLLPVLFRNIADDRLMDVIDGMFRNGKALSWLTAVFRGEMFSHGRVGDRPSHKNEYIFSDEQLDAITTVMVGRYKQMTFEDFAALPKPLSALFGWSQGGDPDGPRNLIAKKITSDAGLLDALEKMTGKGVSVGGEYLSLTRSNLSSFLDYDDARRRVEGISENGRAAKARGRASLLKKYFKTGDEK